MQTVTINAENRNDLGKKANKALRADGGIPAVLYGGDAVHHFTTTQKDVKSLIYTADFKLAVINIDGSDHKAIVQDIQFHPVTDSILHIDFLKLIDGQTVKVELPVRFKGVSPGVRSGGKLIQSMRKVKVKTTPENMVDELLVDISHVELGGAVRVKEIEIGSGVEIITDGSIPVATVEVPRALKSAAAEEEKATEAEESAAV